MDKFVRDAFILFIGNFFSKILGLIFIFPFSNMIGPIGLSLYTYAYVPYALFLDLATLGIPMGISKLVAKYNALNKKETSKYLYQKSIYLMMLIGLCSFIVLNLIAPWYAKMVLGGSLDNQLEDVIKVIRIISLALLIVPNISLMRGFLQGNLKMLPTSLSQIIEQLIRVVIILVGTYYVIKINQDIYQKAVNISVFAAFIGAFFAFFLLLFYTKKTISPIYGKSDEKKVFIEVFKYALPYAFYGISLSLYQVIDSLTFNKGLIQYGISNPEYYYGVYAFEVQKLIFIPIILATSLATSLMPNLTDAFTRSDQNKINKMIFQSISLIIYFLFPITLYFLIFSLSIYSTLYNNVSIGPNILFYSSFTIIFLGCNSVLMGIMQGVNLQKKLIYSLLSGIGFKLILNLILINQLGYIGAIIATLSGLSICIVLNVIFLKKAKFIALRKLFKSLLFISALACLLILPVYFIKNALPVPKNFISQVIYLACFGGGYFLSYYLLMKKSPFYSFQIK